MTFVLITLCLVNILLLIKSGFTEDRLINMNKHIEDRWIAERENWHKERQQLLDRIQAPSFAEYKHAEVKTIKAQNGEKEPPKLEQL